MDMTKSEALKTSYEAFKWAKWYGPCADTRRVACKDPLIAYQYAMWVPGEGSSDETRKAACALPRIAYCYAFFVDKCVHKDTCNAASLDPEIKEQYYNNIKSRRTYGREG